MEQLLSVFDSHILKSVAQNERDGVEEIRLSRTVSTHNQIVLRTEWIHLQTISITLETTDDHLFDVHLSLSLSLSLPIQSEFQKIQILNAGKNVGSIQ